MFSSRFTLLQSYSNIFNDLSVSLDNNTIFLALLELISLIDSQKDSSNADNDPLLLNLRQRCIEKINSISPSFLHENFQTSNQWINRKSLINFEFLNNFKQYLIESPTSQSFPKSTRPNVNDISKEISSVSSYDHHVINNISSDNQKKSNTSISTNASRLSHVVKYQKTEESEPVISSFMTGSEKKELDDFQKKGKTYIQKPQNKSLGVKRKFVSPVVQNNNDSNTIDSLPSFMQKAIEDTFASSDSSSSSTSDISNIINTLKNFDPKLVETICLEIIDHRPGVTWDEIMGLEFAKKTVMEAVIWPLKRPDIFTGLRGPPKGILLFGPPGTGKTMIGKAIASEAGATFFSISAASLTSKWYGEGEKLVRVLFAVASLHQPAVIFIDEVDSLLSQRSEGDFEASRRSKTEFLVQLDGLGSEKERILVVGATNRPQDLDEAARRRFVKRLYIPLPSPKPRQQLIENLLKNESHKLSPNDIQYIVQKTDGYSGADLNNLCKESALGPIRDLVTADITLMQVNDVRPIQQSDFEMALNTVRASVSSDQLIQYIDWNNQYGSFSEYHVDNK